MLICVLKACTWASFDAGLTFVAQFFVFRVIIANYYWSIMIAAIAALPVKPVRLFFQCKLYDSAADVVCQSLLLLEHVQSGTMDRSGTFNFASTCRLFRLYGACMQTVYL